MVHDIIVAGGSLWLALALRYGLNNLPPSSDVAMAVGLFGAMGGVSFWAFRLGRGIWRFASLVDLRNIILASAVTVLAFLLTMFLVNRLAIIPRSVPIIAWFILIVMLSGPRLAHRLWRDSGLDRLRNLRAAPECQKRLVIVGSATEAERLIRRFALDQSGIYKLAGIVDLKEVSKGRSVRGVPLLGGVAEISAILDQLERRDTLPDAIVLASEGQHLHELTNLPVLAANRGIAIARFPGLSDVINGADPGLEPITFDDLLGRAPVRLQLNRISETISGAVVLVTGAGGTIGSEIARQVVRYGPRRLVLLDNSEFNLYSIDRQIRAIDAKVDRIPVLTSVRRKRAIENLFLKERPDIVFHAAALKHVPLAEGNVCEAILTNVLGTRIVAEAAIEARSKAVIMISTDKAIRPVGIMGQTKRVAEAYCQALDVDGTETRFITVRFGNVLGSTGSVVPLFQEQIARGGPVTVTHPEMRRYFMTIQEATQLVLQAAVHGLGHSEERGSIVVLDMGQPVPIIDLARTMIALTGRRPEIDIPIEFTGIRPGEKLFEDLFDPEECPSPSSTDGLFISSPRALEKDVLDPKINDLVEAALRHDDYLARSLLKSLVVELSGAPDLRNGTCREATQPDQARSMRSAAAR